MYGLPPPNLYAFPFAGEHGRGVRVGGPPPHEDDYWVSTDDSLDYARWLNRRIDAFNTLADKWRYEQATVATAGRWYAETDWSMWRFHWQEYFAKLEDSWWARVNSWETIKQWHKEYLEHVEHARKLGLPVGDSVAEAPLPREIPDRVADAAEDIGRGTRDVLMVAAVAAAGVGAFLLLQRKP